MQIEFDIDEELNDWAAWARSDKRYGGYPGVSAGFEEYIAGYRVSGRRITVSDNRACVIDACVQQMAETSPEWGEIIFDKYIRGLSDARLCKKIKASRTHVRERLKSAQGCVAGLLMSPPFVEAVEEKIGIS